MKKEIMQLIETEGRMKVNEICTLLRLRKYALGFDVDGLNLEFTDLNGVGKLINVYEIKSRTYEGIIEECCMYMERYLKDASEYFQKQFRNGYNTYGWVIKL